MQVSSTVLPSGQTVDVIEHGEVPHRAGALLLHGSGTSERLSLRSLGASLASRNIAVVIPDWHPPDAASSIPPVLVFADDVFERLGLAVAQRTVVGYSAGGRPAFSLMADPERRFSRCVAVATSYFGPVAAHQGRDTGAGFQVLLVHGDADKVRHWSTSELLRDELVEAEFDARLAVIAGGTHANVVCAEFEPRLQLSNPAAVLTRPMRESVETIAEFVLR